jgi:predicted amidophosphoribosyltransferase
VACFAPFKTIDAIIPVPPSHTGRPFQPVVEVARALGDKFNIPVLTDAVKKVKETPELKNVTDFKERKRLLLFAFKVQQPEAVAGKTVLLFDDIYRSGGTLSMLTWVLYHEAQAACVKVLTLTRTRSKT